MEKPKIICEAGKTRQDMKDETDINKLMDRYKRTGILPTSVKGVPHYGDFTEVPTIEEAHNKIVTLHDQFAALGSQVRKKFDNDPLKMVNWLQDPKNTEEGIKLGLLIPKVKDDNKVNTDDNNSNTGDK